MLTERQQHLSNQTARRKICLRIKSGAQKMLHSKWRMLGLVALCVLLMAVFMCCKTHANSGGIAAVSSNLWCCALYMGAPVVILEYLLLIGTPWGADLIEDNLQRAGIVNEVDEPPILLEIGFSQENDRVRILEFQTVGIPMNLWKDKQLAAESALDAYIVKVQESQKRNRVFLHTVKSEGAFPEIARWDENYLPKGDGVLAIGITVAGTVVTVDLSNTPHVLIGGSSGSGKSVLMGLLLSQTIKKGMILYIADFKGGLDYNGDPWMDSCSLITTVDDVTMTLDELTAELERRKQLFYETSCKNIAMYNNHTGCTLPRIVFGCDEIAELTDKSGLSDKELKTRIDHIIGLLSTIARQGRALGIHLILATQRPDANILPGQIKNNIDFRACGRADNTLAMIILDNADAADKLPKDGHRFMLPDGNIFLPYYWGED